MHHSLADIQADFEINRPVRYQITAKRNYFYRRQTDIQTDGQTSRTTTIGSFFSKKEKTTKNEWLICGTVGLSSGGGTG